MHISNYTAQNNKILCILKLKYERYCIRAQDRAGPRYVQREGLQKARQSMGNNLKDNFNGIV